MLGLMQQRPLLISSLLDYAERYHAGTEIVSRSVEGPLHRSNWGLIASRARRVANALKRLGVTGSERIATLALNHNRHLEIYFGVTCSGAILHTVNPRLFPDQVRFILDDAEARYVFFDVAFTALIEQIAPRLPNVRGFVALCECSALPSIEVPNLLCYEELLASEIGRVRVAIVRREHRIGAVLHLRHHRQPERRPAEPPIGRAAQLLADGGRYDGDIGARLAAAVRPAVPCQLLGHSIRRGGHWCKDGAARHEAGRRQPV